MSEQDMSGQQAGQGGGAGFGRAAEGQAPPGPDPMYRAGMSQAPGWAMPQVPYGAPVMPFMFQAPPYPTAHAGAYGWPPPMPGYPPAMTPTAGQVAGGRQGWGQVMEEIANGGSGLSGLSKLLDFDDKDFWKGALVGAAAVLLLTNENVQRALFRGAVKGRDAVEEGVEKVKAGADKLKQAAREAKEE